MVTNLRVNFYSNTNSIGVFSPLCIRVHMYLIHDIHDRVPFLPFHFRMSIPWNARHTSVLSPYNPTCYFPVPRTFPDKVPVSCNTGLVESFPRLGPCHTSSYLCITLSQHFPAGPASIKASPIPYQYPSLDKLRYSTRYCIVQYTVPSTYMVALR